MWADDLAMAKAIAAEMLKLVRPDARKPDAPEPAPAPFVPERPKKNETWLEAHQRRIRDDVRAGRAVSMNALGREAASKIRPPRKPGQQQQRSNGSWRWWTVA